MTEYFAILSFHTGKALTVPWNFIEENVLKLSEFEEEDNQFWFWDGRAICSTYHPNKVLDFHYYDWKKQVVERSIFMTIMENPINAGI